VKGTEGPGEQGDPGIVGVDLGGGLADVNLPALRKGKPKSGETSIGSSSIAAWRVCARRARGFVDVEVLARGYVCGDMRTMFFLYLVVIAAGLVGFTLLGLLQR
jgi:hypothetical protein